MGAPTVHGKLKYRDAWYDDTPSAVDPVLIDILSCDETNPKELEDIRRNLTNHDGTLTPMGRKFKELNPEKYSHLFEDALLESASEKDAPLDRKLPEKKLSIFSRLFDDDVPEKPTTSLFYVIPPAFSEEIDNCLTALEKTGQQDQFKKVRSIVAQYSRTKFVSKDSAVDELNRAYHELQEALGDAYFASSNLKQTLGDMLSSLSIEDESQRLAATTNHVSSAVTRVSEEEGVFPPQKRRRVERTDSLHRSPEGRRSEELPDVPLPIDEFGFNGFNELLNDSPDEVFGSALSGYSKGKLASPSKAS